MSASDGISRSKRDYNGLVDILLDGLPAHIWSQEGLTFCDPAMGGGQLVVGIEDRLKSAGRDAGYIAAHVFGYESNVIMPAYAKAKHKLSGTYTVGTLETIPMRKFDVIITNPPYQDGSGDKNTRKGTGKLWPKFWQFAIDNVKDNGFIIFISPSTWSSVSKDMGVSEKIMQTLTSSFNLMHVWFGLTSKYFHGVGIDIAAFVVQKTSYQGKTYINTNPISYDFAGMDFIPKSLDKLDIDIMRKVSGKQGPRFSFHAVACSKEEKDYEFLESSGNYEWLETMARKNDTGTDLTVRINYTKKKPPQKSMYGVPKVHMTRRCASPVFTIDTEGRFACRYNSHAAIVSAGKSARQLEAIFSSKFVKFLMRNQWHQFAEQKIASLIPDIKVDPKDADKSLADYFDLTEAEREYINECF